VAKVTKHQHAFAVLSHTEDRLSVLLGCQIKPCITVESRHLERSKVRIDIRKYRQMTKDEFFDSLRGIPHLCCQGR
jgi:hypothetical protein